MDLGAMTDKFSETGQKVIYRAIEVSKSRDHNFLSVEHIFTALSDVEGALFAEAMQSIGVEPRAVGHLLDQELGKSRQYVGKKMRSLTEEEVAIIQKTIDSWRGASLRGTATKKSR